MLGYPEIQKHICTLQELNLIISKEMDKYTDRAKIVCNAHTWFVWVRILPQPMQATVWFVSFTNGLLCIRSISFEKKQVHV